MWWNGIIALHCKCVFLRFVLNDWEGHIAIDIHIIIFTIYYHHHFDVCVKHGLHLKWIPNGFQEMVLLQFIWIFYRQIFECRVCFASFCLGLFVIAVVRRDLRRKYTLFVCLFVCLFIEVKASVKWKCFKCCCCFFINHPKRQQLFFFLSFIHSFTTSLKHSYTHNTHTHPPQKSKK